MIAEDSRESVIELIQDMHQLLLDDEAVGPVLKARR